jgi:cysteinyl-tRNA synthetase
VTQDILRRIVSDYFGYDVHFVMNITDIDDKVLSSLPTPSVMMVKTLKSITSRSFTFTDHHTGQARPSGPGVPSQQFGTDAPASG